MIIALSSEISVMSAVSQILWKDKKIAYIDTASIWQWWDMSWREKQIEAIEKEFWKIFRYSIEWKKISDFERDLQDFDILHIGWWNTAYLLYHIKKTWFDKYLRAIQNSKDIVGSSAGAVVLWSSIEHIKSLDDFSVVKLENYNGIWFVSFDIMVHFWKEKYRESYRKSFDIAYNSSTKWVYLDDNSYIISHETGIQICNV